MLPDDRPPMQLPLWNVEPPEEVGPLLDMIERLRADTSVCIKQSLRGMADANDIRVILQRQAASIEVMLASFEASRPVVLLPDFAGDDYSALESAVLALIPSTSEQLADVEEAVKWARTDPENRKLVARITESLPARADIGRMTIWAAFFTVAAFLLEVAPELNANTIAMLAIIVMVLLYVLPPRARS